MDIQIKRVQNVADTTEMEIDDARENENSKTQKGEKNGGWGRRENIN